MDIGPNSYVVLWSPKQKTIHVETFEEMIKENRRIFENDASGDFILLDVKQTEKEADALAKKMIEIRNARESR